MPALIKSVAKYIGYGAFFVAALVVFVYLTLPLDAVRDLLVRKAADEYGANLSITELDTWGLGGLRAAGVTITPRPTPEERAEMEAAREARREWEARQKARAGAAVKKGGADGADAGPTGGDAEPAAAATKKDDAAEEPPPLPAGPLPLHIDEIRARVGLLDLISGLVDGRLEAELLGGTLEADVTRTHEAVAIKARWSALDLRQFQILRRFLPLPITGALEGEVDLEVPTDDAGRPRSSRALGHVALKVTRGSIGPGRIESDQLGAFRYFDVPRATFTELGGRIEVAKRRATFEKFELTGKDLEGELTGYVQLADRLERWAPRAHLRFRFSDEFLEKNRDVKVAMTSIPYIKRGQLDGYTGLSITGTLDKPRVQPRKRSPYVTGGRASSRAKADRDDEKDTDRLRRERARRATERLRRARERSRDLARERKERDRPGAARRGSPPRGDDDGEARVRPFRGVPSHRVAPEPADPVDEPEDEGTEPTDTEEPAPDPAEAEPDAGGDTVPLEITEVDTADEETGGIGGTGGEADAGEPPPTE